MPLIIAETGRELKVIKILSNDKVKKHLESLGITINSIIRILGRNSGSVIILVKESRLALDKGIATSIFVA